MEGKCNRVAMTTEHNALRAADNHWTPPPVGKHINKLLSARINAVRWIRTRFVSYQELVDKIFSSCSVILL